MTNAAVVVDGALSASGDFSIATTAFAVASSSGDTSVGGTLGVTGAATLQDALTVSGATTVSNTLTVTQGASLQSTLNVGGTFTVATTKFTVDSSNGNTATTGSLNVERRCHVGQQSFSEWRWQPLLTYLCLRLRPS